MQEKIMVNDTLNGLNGEILRFAEMIPHTEHEQLKNVMIQQRNACEQSHDELYKLAREKGYHVPSAMAKPDDIANVKSLATRGAI